MRNLILMISMIAMFLAACAPTLVEKAPPAEVKNITPIPNITEEVVAPAPVQEEYVQLNKSINTLFNNKQQKFKWSTYVIELLSVSGDNTLCQLKINGKTGFYEKNKPVDFDKNLRVEVLDAVVTHGFTGDACKVAMYNPN